jgi:hypothetical protein
VLPPTFTLFCCMADADGKLRYRQSRYRAAMLNDPET